MKTLENYSILYIISVVIVAIVGTVILYRNQIKNLFREWRYKRLQNCKHKSLIRRLNDGWTSVEPEEIMYYKCPNCKKTLHQINFS